MAEHTVIVQHAEANEYNVSVTGTVDGMPVSIVLRWTDLPGALRGKTIAQISRNALLREAFDAAVAGPLARAFEARGQADAAEIGRRVRV